MKFFTSKRGLLLVLASFVLLISGAWAQTGTTSLHGKVVDSSHATVPGAKVTLANQTRGFFAPLLPPRRANFSLLPFPPAHMY
jgi:hypothetical protein